MGEGKTREGQRGGQGGKKRGAGRGEAKDRAWAGGGREGAEERHGERKGGAGRGETGRGGGAENEGQGGEEGGAGRGEAEHTEGGKVGQGGRKPRARVGEWGGRERGEVGGGERRRGAGCGLRRGREWSGSARGRKRRAAEEGRGEEKVNEGSARAGRSEWRAVGNGEGGREGQKRRQGSGHAEGRGGGSGWHEGAGGCDCEGGDPGKGCVPVGARVRIAQDPEAAGPTFLLAAAPTLFLVPATPPDRSHTAAIATRISRFGRDGEGLLGITAVWGGGYVRTEVVVRGVRRALADHPDWVVLQLDVANAFNSFHRDRMFQALQASPEFSVSDPLHRPLLRDALGSPLQVRHGSGHDALGAGHSPGRPSQPLLVRSDTASCFGAGSGGGDVQLWSYADDTYVLGPPDRVLHHFAEIVRRLGEMGLAAQPHKCLVYQTESFLSRDLEAFTGLGIEVARRGLTVTGVPVGTVSFVEQSLPDRLERMGRVLPWLPRLRQPQTAARLLSACVSTRPQYLSRTVPPSPAVISSFTRFASGEPEQIDRALQTALEGLPPDVLSLLPPWPSCASASPDSLFAGASRSSGGACLGGRACPSHLSLAPCPFDFPSGRRCRSVVDAIDDMTVPHHAVRCPRYGVATTIHDTVKYMLRDFAVEAGFAVKVEDYTLFTQLEAARARLLGQPVVGEGTRAEGPGERRGEAGQPGGGGQWGRHQLRGQVERGTGGQRGRQGEQTGQDGEGGRHRQQQGEPVEAAGPGRRASRFGLGGGAGAGAAESGRRYRRAAGLGGEGQGVREAAGDGAGGSGGLGEGREGEGRGQVDGGEERGKRDDRRGGTKGPDRAAASATAGTSRTHRPSGGNVQLRRATPTQIGVAAARRVQEKLRHWGPHLEGLQPAPHFYACVAETFGLLSEPLRHHTPCPLMPSAPPAPTLRVPAPLAASFDTPCPPRRFPRPHSLLPARALPSFTFSSPLPSSAARLFLPLADPTPLPAPPQSAPCPSYLAPLCLVSPPPLPPRRLSPPPTLPPLPAPPTSPTLALGFLPPCPTFPPSVCSASPLPAPPSSPPCPSFSAPPRRFLPSPRLPFFLRASPLLPPCPRSAHAPVSGFSPPCPTFLPSLPTPSAPPFLFPPCPSLPPPLPFALPSLRSLLPIPAALLPPSAHPHHQPPSHPSLPPPFPSLSFSHTHTHTPLPHPPHPHPPILPLPAPFPPPRTPLTSHLRATGFPPPMVPPLHRSPPLLTLLPAPFPCPQLAQPLPVAAPTPCPPQLPCPPVHPSPIQPPPPSPGCPFPLSTPATVCGFQPPNGGAHGAFLRTGKPPRGAPTPAGSLFGQKNENENIGRAEIVLSFSRLPLPRHVPSKGHKWVQHEDFPGGHPAQYCSTLFTQLEAARARLLGQPVVGEGTRAEGPGERRGVAGQPGGGGQWGRHQLRGQVERGTGGQRDGRGSRQARTGRGDGTGSSRRASGGRGPRAPRLQVRPWGRGRGGSSRERTEVQEGQRDGRGGPGSERGSRGWSRGVREVWGRVREGEGRGQVDGGEERGRETIGEGAPRDQTGQQPAQQQGPVGRTGRVGTASRIPDPTCRDVARSHPLPPHAIRSPRPYPPRARSLAASFDPPCPPRLFPTARHSLLPRPCAPLVYLLLPPPLLSAARLFLPLADPLHSLPLLNPHPALVSRPPMLGFSPPCPSPPFSAPHPPPSPCPPHSPTLALASYLPAPPFPPLCAQLLPSLPLPPPALPLVFRPPRPVSPLPAPPFLSPCLSSAPSLPPPAHAPVFGFSPPCPTFLPSLPTPSAPPLFSPHPLLLPSCLDFPHPCPCSPTIHAPRFPPLCTFSLFPPCPSFLPPCPLLSPRYAPFSPSLLPSYHHQPIPTPAPLPPFSPPLPFPLSLSHTHTRTLPPPPPHPHPPILPLPAPFPPPSHAPHLPPSVQLVSPPYGASLASLAPLLTLCPPLFRALSWPSPCPLLPLPLPTQLPCPPYTPVPSNRPHPPRLPVPLSTPATVCGFHRPTVHYALSPYPPPRPQAGLSPPASRLPALSTAALCPCVTLAHFIPPPPSPPPPASPYITRMSPLHCPQRPSTPFLLSPLPLCPPHLYEPYFPLQPPFSPQLLPHPASTPLLLLPGLCRPQPPSAVPRHQTASPSPANFCTPVPAPCALQHPTSTPPVSPFSNTLHISSPWGSPIRSYHPSSIPQFPLSPVSGPRILSCIYHSTSFRCPLCPPTFYPTPPNLSHYPLPGSRQLDYHYPLPSSLFPTFPFPPGSTCPPPPPVEFCLPPPPWPTTCPHTLLTHRYTTPAPPPPLQPANTSPLNRPPARPPLGPNPLQLSGPLYPLSTHCAPLSPPFPLSQANPRTPASARSSFPFDALLSQPQQLTRHRQACCLCNNAPAPRVGERQAGSPSAIWRYRSRATHTLPLPHFNKPGGNLQLTLHGKGIVSLCVKEQQRLQRMGSKGCTGGAMGVVGEGAAEAAEERAAEAAREGAAAAARERAAGAAREGAAGTVTLARQRAEAMETGFAE
ncbi:unnamed protein product [Closterium sp. NIES-65]|nr:unnamed protein product [Closterium sp. NIES-65]